MIKFNQIAKVMSNVAGRTGLKVSKFSPEILIVTGVLGIVGSTVLACKATLKVEDIIDVAKEKVDKVNYANENVSKNEYSALDYRKDLAITYLQTGGSLVKIYAPSIVVGVISITAILGSYRIMKTRNIALMAAYKGIEEAFTSYRKRVVTELGSDKDKEFRYGVHTEKISTTEIGADGKEVVTEKEVKVLNADGSAASLYAKFFDEYSINWSKTPEYNLVFLKCQQQMANDLLNARGHLFLNEVYDMLGIPRTQAGVIVGWVKGNGDSYVDFGIYDPSISNREFVNGYERSILLDFNVDGVVYDKI